MKQVPSGPETNTRLAASVARIEAGELEAADTILSAVLATEPSHPVALYLLGVARFESGRWSEAEPLFRRALEISPGQIKISLHLAQCLRALQRAPEALPYCRAVLSAAPDHAGAWLELAKAQEESGATLEAEATYRQILARGNDPDAVLNFSRLLNRIGRAPEAETILRKALPSMRRVPSMDKTTRARLEHELGVTLTLQRRDEEALTHMEAARALAPNGSREQKLERAELLCHLDRFDEVATAYQGLLAADPLDMPVHILLSELRYQQKSEDFLASYDAALAHAPGAVSLPVAKGRLLFKLGRAGQAEDAFRAALHMAPDDSAALTGLGRALEAEGDFEGAHATYEKAFARGQSDGDMLEDYAGFLLRQGEAMKAEALAEQACRLRPASQAGLGILSLCYRARNNARETWLSDYQDHVQIFDLEPPDGYADMASFNRDLATYLEGLHGGAREYFTQTLRGGTQLFGDLFHRGHPLVDLLLPRITGAIRTYVARLAAKPGHPLVARRTQGFRYAGSWSSRLGDRGFHVNHLHQKGWISSCYYVSVPDAVADPEAQQGWIKFGEPPAEFGLDFAARRTVQPVPGRLVLFPSFMWHGTTPFHAPQPRITIAFDAVPG